MTDLEPVLLSRIQFAFTVSFHIIFPAVTIGLASWLAVVEGLWLKTQQNVYREIYKFWVKIFAICFGMGVVSGVVLSYQFGTNWSIFLDSTGNVIGPLLGYEVLTAFFLMTGLGVVAGYALLSAAWMFMKGEGELRIWARKCAKYVFVYVLGFMALVSLWVPFLENDIDQRWFGGNNIYYLMPIPLLTGVLFIALWRAIESDNRKRDWLPFLLSLGIFFMGYLGLAISLWPHVVPYDVTLWQAAAAPESLSLMLVGVVIMLPIILAYTGWCYYVFRGKTSHINHGY